jgi:hypothetical protein
VRIGYAWRHFLEQGEKGVDRNELKIDSDEGIKYLSGIIGIVDSTVMGSDQF